VRPGRAIGESDPHGNEPLTQPITPAMVGATMLFGDMGNTFQLSVARVAGHAMFTGYSYAYELLTF